MLKDRTLKTTLISTHIRTEGTRYSEEAQRFHAWLVAHVTRKPDIQTEQAYKQESAAQLYRGKHIQQFAPFRAAQSAYQTWTPGQVALLSAFAAITLVSIILTGISTLTTIFSVVTLFYVALLGLSVAWLLGVSRPAPATPFSLQIIDELKHAPWPSYTILCPLYKEKAVVPQFVEAIRALDYPTDCLQVLFLTEADDEETRQAILALRLPSHFQILVVPPGSPKTKPRACNYGLLHATGEYIVIFDAEDIPDPLQLKKAVLTFASCDPTVACVQAKLNFYNPAQNLLTRWFTIEYTLWFGLILPGLQRLGFSLPLGGTSNHFRASALRHVGAWDAFNVTEDCDLGLKLAQYGLQTVVLDSLTMEEANSRPLSWIKQRSRWIKGYMQTYLVHTRHPLDMVRQGKIKDLLSLHLFVGVGSIMLLVNPIMWAMFAAYLIWHPVALYHQLFPWPVLYAGMLCFLVGNFLPIYASMIACVRQEQYALVKWCLLLPLYWILASAAAVLAAYELIRKPHHWHKTQHGLHLKGRATAKVLAVSGNATQIANIQGPIAVAQAITASMRAMPTVLTPAVSAVKGKRTRARDPWLLLTIAIACVCSVAATAYFTLHHETLLYVDAYSHLRIARSVIDSKTPGLAQLGGVWLPLHHLFIDLFVWNDFLWRTGLAGSLPAMAFYLIGGVYIYLTAKRLTHNGVASFLGTLVFLLNPSVLYLQSTPLSDILCTGAFVVACYYFLCWAEERKVSQLILCAASTFMVTLLRYDGWALFMSLTVLVVFMNYRQRRSLVNAEGLLIFYGSLSGLGILLWFIWCKLIFGDPLFFQHGAYSSQAQQMVYLKEGHLYTYHSIWQSLRYYSIDAAETTGVVIFIVASIAMLLFLVKYKWSWKGCAVLPFLVPFAFYVATLYTGQSIIYIPDALPYHMTFDHYNTRYGVQMVASCAVWIALLIGVIQTMFKKKWYYASLILIAMLVLAQSFISTVQGSVALQDGLSNCTIAVNKMDIPTYLSEHYTGGAILEDESVALLNPQDFGARSQDTIYQGNSGYWQEALAHPARYVTWIAVAPGNSLDLVAHGIDTHSSYFLSHFQLVKQQDDGLYLFHRKSDPLLTHPASSYLLAVQKMCSQGGSNV